MIFFIHSALKGSPTHIFTRPSSQTVSLLLFTARSPGQSHGTEEKGKATGRSQLMQNTVCHFSKNNCKGLTVNHCETDTFQIPTEHDTMRSSFLEQQGFLWRKFGQAVFLLSLLFWQLPSTLFTGLSHLYQDIEMPSPFFLLFCTIFHFLKKRKIEAILPIIYRWSRNFSCTRKWLLVIWRWHLYFTVKASILFFFSVLLTPPPRLKAELIQ